MTERELLEELCGLLSSGRVDNSFIVPALRALSRRSAKARPMPELLGALQSLPGPSFESLATHLRVRCRAEASRCHHRKRAGGDVSEFRDILGDLPLDGPVGWSTIESSVEALRLALVHLREIAFLDNRPEPLPQIRGVLSGRLASLLARAGALIDPLPLLERLSEATLDGEARAALGAIGRTLAERAPAAVRQAAEHLSGADVPFPAELAQDEAADLLASPNGAERTKRALDAACSWPTSRMAPVIPRLAAGDSRLRERAALLLTLRFGDAAAQDWSSWSSWLARTAEQDERAAGEYRALEREHAAELLFLWSLARPWVPAEARRALEGLCAGSAAPLESAAFLARHAGSLSAAERRILGGGAPAPAEAARPAAVARPAEPRPARRTAPRPAAPVPPPPPAPAPEPEPSLWDDHVLPFFTANWTMLTGIAMVVVGSSLLAFYTWDKHWLLRYTILPLLLGGFTGSLARIASWIESRDAKLKGTADMLRGAAVALLPANFMAVALLARDPQVPAKAVVLGAFTGLYLLAAGLALSRWCAAVHPALSRLGRTLLLIDALVLLGPLAALADPSGAWLGAGLAAGFHLGFALLAAAVVRFLADDLTPSMIEEGRVPWFFGLTLASTFLQVFVWVNGFMRHAPSAQTYACMVIAAGGLVLFTERSPLIRKAGDPVYGKNSFMGYALVLLGLLMGAPEPRVRTLSLALAGAVWLSQAVVHRDLLHGWIGFTLFALSGGSLAAWPGFPGPWVAALGLALALASGAAAPAAARLWGELAKVAAGTQAALLAATICAAVLAQAHYRTPPLWTAAALAASAALFAWRAARDERVGYAVTAMATLAAALPYLGLADVSGLNLAGNNVVFGLGVLSCLWLGLLSARPSPLLLRARSTVLLLYGSLGTAALCLRVYFEVGLAADGAGLAGWVALGGPLLMTAALAATAYHSRSLLPMLLAGVQAVILLPELKSEITAHLPFVEWGSGLTSALAAAALVWACFPLRASAALSALDEGDSLADGSPFPLKRRDHTLFTWPLLASAMFLLVKVDSWNLARQLAAGPVGVKAALGLLVAGAAWTLLAAYFREDPNGRPLVHVGWMSAAAGLGIAYARLAEPAVWHHGLLAIVLFLDGLFLAYRRLLAPSRPWAEELLAGPMRGVLRLGAVLLGAAVLGALLAGVPAAALVPLGLAAAAHLVWFGLADGHPVYGTLLLLEAAAAALAFAEPGAGPLLPRVSPLAWPLLALLGAVTAAQTLLEPFPETEKAVRPLSAPIVFWTTLGIGAAAVFGLLDSLTLRSAGLERQGALLVLVLAAARGQGCGPLALAGLALAYVDLCAPALAAAGSHPARLQALLVPWRLGAFALGAAALGSAGLRLSESRPALAQGANSQEFFRLPALPLVYGSALAAAAEAVLHHASEPGLRDAAANLAAPYLAAGAFALVSAARGPWGPLAWIAVLFVTAGNVHAVRLYAGAFLRGHGLLENHLLCLGAVLSLAQARAAGLAVGREEALRFFNRAGLVVSASVLAFLTSTYFVDASLEDMSSARFLVSGAMAWLAGRSFHRAARRPDPGEEAFADFWEGAYHFSLTTALWCAALLVPALRTPFAAFPALALPVLYFYLRAELGSRSDATAIRYRNTAATLSFFLLVLYAFRGAFQAVLFPGAPLGVEHYQFNAPFVMGLALVMLRLHGLGGTGWLAFYAGPAMMVGSFFLLTCAPGLSPFTDPVPAAWCAIGLGHFWMLASSQPSPVMSFLQRVGEVDDEGWAKHRGNWGVFLLASTQAALAWGLADYQASPYAVAPLLAGGATLLAHQALIRGSRPLWRFAAWEAFAALHAGFLVASYLPKPLVVWAVLAAWTAYLAAAQHRPQSLVGTEIGKISKRLGFLVFLHVLYHGPASPAGLAAFAALAALGAATPMASFQQQPEARSAAMFLIAAPTWLALFANVHHGSSWTALVCSAALLSTGYLARWVQDRLPNVGGTTPRLYHQAWGLLAEEGRVVNGRLATAAFLLAAGVQVLHYDRAFEPQALGFFLGLYAALAVAFYREGRLRETTPPFVLLEASILAALALARRQVLLTTGAWTPEFDVWAGLLASAILTGTKQAFPLAPAGARAPLSGTLLALPAVTLAWVLLRGLGTDAVLLVVGLQALMFAYLGKDERESPYHLVSVGGAVAFVLIAFWTKLELRMVQAYVIPVGLGVMTLLQLFRDKIAADVRNQIRAVTLLAMLGSAGYYAIVDERYPLAFHMCMLALTVSSMAVGSLLKIRLYVLLGFVGLLTDLAALVYKVLVTLDRSARMTIIGGQVLAFGTLLIVGAVLYKTHQEKINELVDRWRGELRSWE